MEIVIESPAGYADDRGLENAWRVALLIDKASNLLQ